MDGTDRRGASCARLARAGAQAQSGAQTAPPRNARRPAQAPGHMMRESGSRRSGAPGGGANAAICNVRRVPRGGGENGTKTDRKEGLHAENGKERRRVECLERRGGTGGFMPEAAMGYAPPACGS